MNNAAIPRSQRKIINFFFSTQKRLFNAKGLPKITRNFEEKHSTSTKSATNPFHLYLEIGRRASQRI